MNRLKKYFFFLCFLCLLTDSLQAKKIGFITENILLTDISGTEHNLTNYLSTGKSVILNFSSTWCRPCWNYERSGVMDRVYETFGPEGTDEVMVLFIEADPSTCDDCLFGQEKCNDFTYGNWTNKSYPTISLKERNFALNDEYQIKRFPSIIGLSSKDRSISLLGQLSFSNWNSWIGEQSDKFRFAFLERAEAQKAKRDYFVKYVKSPSKLRTKEMKNVNLELYPNPCSEIINIDLDFDNAVVSSFALFDGKGNKIRNKFPVKLRMGRTTLDISDLQSGVYFARFKSSGEEIVKKFIVLR